MQRKRQRRRAGRPDMRMPPINAQMKMTTDVLAGSAGLILGTGALNMAMGTFKALHP